MPNEKQVLNFEISKELYEKAKLEADRLEIPLAGFIRQLIVKYFESQRYEVK